MRKRMTFIISLLVGLSLVLSACGLAATAPPAFSWPIIISDQTVIQLVKDDVSLIQHQGQTVWALKAPPTDGEWGGMSEDEQKTQCQTWHTEYNSTRTKLLETTSGLKKGELQIVLQGLLQKIQARCGKWYSIGPRESDGFPTISPKPENTVNTTPPTNTPVSPTVTPVPPTETPEN